MKIMKRCFSGFIMMLMIASLVPITAWASSGTITSVSIKMNNDLSTGDYVDDNDINIGESGGTINVYVSSNKYEITGTELVTSENHELKVGDEVKLKVTLEPVGDYYFKGTYSSSNIHVSGGEYSSNTKSTSKIVVTVKLKPLKGTYDMPEDVEWKDSGMGKATWDDPDSNGTGYYEIMLKRGGSEVTRIKDYKGTSYNFYPYMTSKGTYTFRIKTVPHSDVQIDYGTASEWEESDEFYIDEENVSDGTGIAGNTDSSGVAGWVQNSGVWYYKYPDGSYKKNGWVQVSDKWYMFDSYGKMLTGWQASNNNTYYLSDNGDMLTGWINNGDKWYYLNEISGDTPEGSVVKDSWLTATDGRKYYMNTSGVMSEGWTDIDGSWYYFYPGSGFMAVSTTINTFVLGADGVWGH